MSGAVRPMGVLVALATAAAVFGIGMLVLPSVEPPPPPPPPPVVQPVAPPPAPPVPAATDAASDSGSDAPDALDAKADAEATSAPAAAAPPSAPLEPKPIAAQPPAAAPAPADKAEAAGPRDKLVEKEVAREAWRKNLPDISVDAGKAALLIPIKGSIDGATYHVTGKPHSVLVTLPKGESMITMPFYSVRHDGFRQLWIKKDEQTGATILRIVLGESGDPQVEIKDDFVRITVRRTTEAPAAAPVQGGPAAPGPAAAPPSPPPAPAPGG